MKLTSKINYLVALIFFCAFAVRIIAIADIPPGLNRDEAAIGYTAYSLLKTGKDEWGVRWPLSIKSFGDWKLPLYIYASIPSVAYFGLTEFAVRLPSALCGTSTVLLTYVITQKLFKKRGLSLIAMVILAISPWHIFFSRVASEANLAVFLSALAFYLILSLSEKYYYGPLAAVLLGLTLLTYHGNHVFTPLLAIGLFFFFRKKLTSNTSGKLSIIILIFMMGYIFAMTLFSADKTKISGLLSINDPSIVHERIVKNRIIFAQPIIGKLINNKVVFLTEDIVQNYVKAFSPEFLFIRGGDNGQHNIPDFGNMYIVEAPFLLFGLYFLFRRKEPFALLLLYWILISPVGASLTKDAPHSARQFAIFPALSIIIAYGIYEVVSVGKFRKITALIVLLLFSLNACLFLSRYFVLFPYKSYALWGDSYKEMVEKIVKYKSNEYEEIAVARPEYSTYIYYLFYAKSDPEDVQRNMVHYPQTDEGFAHVKFYDGVTYRKIDWADDLQRRNRLYVDWSNGIPTGATESSRVKTPDGRRIIASGKIDTVNLPDGTPQFTFIEAQREINLQ